MRLGQALLTFSTAAVVKILTPDRNPVLVPRSILGEFDIGMIKHPVQRNKFIMSQRSLHQILRPAPERNGLAQLACAFVRNRNKPDAGVARMRLNVDEAS